MKRYDEKILNKLLDRYENSLLYFEKNQVHISIAVSINKKTLPEYFDESSLQFDVIHEQLEQLERKGFLRLVWKNKKFGHILEKCELSVEHAEEIYLLLKRKPRNQKEREIRRICETYQSRAEDLDRFLEWVLTRMDANEPIKKYVNVEEPEEFERICDLIWRILTNEDECFLREFSIRQFHDSKMAEKEIEKAACMIAEFSENRQLKELSPDELLEEYNIYRNPSWVMIKGSQVQVSGVNLSCFQGGIGLSNQDIGKLQWSQEKKPEKIVTIENLTSFHQWNPFQKEESVLCIYLGGYHNRAKRLFLKNLYETYPEAVYYHFGDIDCGGFRIWKDLCRQTGIPFQPIYMDMMTYQKYAGLGRELTESDRKTLKNMMEDEFYHRQRTLFEEMLKEGKKLEQECIKCL